MNASPLSPHDAQALAALKRSLEELLNLAGPGRPIGESNPDLTAHLARLGRALLASLDALLADPGKAGAVPAARFLSPDEEQVVGALGSAGRPLRGKEVAQALRLPYGAYVKMLLSNLEARHILSHGRAGYFLPPRPPADAAGPAVRFLSPLEERIVDALAGGPRLGKQIAGRLGETNSPSFRAILGNLANRGAIVRTAYGYSRPPLLPGGHGQGEGGPP